MKKPSTTPIFLAIFAIACIIVLNVIASRIAPKSEQQIEAEQAEAQKKAQEDAKAKGGKSAAASPTDTKSASGSGDSLVTYGEDSTIGARDATHTITIGWSWTPQVQAHPESVGSTIEAIKKQIPQARIRIVNTDAIPSVPDGIAVDGKTIMPPGPDGSLSPEMVRGVQSAIGAMSQASGVSPAGAQPPTKLKNLALPAP